MGGRAEADGPDDRAREAATLGTYYAANRNYDMAIDTFKCSSQYPADSAGHNNLAVAYFGTLNFQRARARAQAIEIYPRSFKYRANFALYAMYAGDFKTAAATAQELIKENPCSRWPTCRSPWRRSRQAMSTGRDCLRAGVEKRRSRCVAWRHRACRPRHVSGAL